MVKYIVVIFTLLSLFGPQLSEAQQHVAGAPSAPHIVSGGRSRAIPAVSASSSIENSNGQILITAKLGDAVPRPASEVVDGVSGFSAITWTGLTASLPGGAAMISSQVSKSDAPVLVVTLAIPTGARALGVSLKNEKIASFPGVKLLPAVVTLDDSTSVRSFDLTRGRTDPWAASVSKSQRFRAITTVVVSIPLARATDAGIEAREAFQLAVNFSIDAPLTTSPSNDPIFDDLYRRMVLNVGDLRHFKSSPRRTSDIQGKGKQTQSWDGRSTFDTNVTKWIDPGAQYAKLSVTRTGLYRVTAPEIASLGIDIAKWRGYQLRLFNHGSQVPIWVDSAADGSVNAFEFYGRHLPGYGLEYYNVSTDTNAYWLTNSASYGEPPLRFNEGAAVPVNHVYTTGEIVLHHEQDKDYHAGDAVTDETSTSHRTEWIPGERFVWRKFKKPHDQEDTGKVVDIFRVAGLPQNLQGKTAEFDFFLRGMSRAGGNSEHRAEIFVNGVKYSEAVFQNYDSIVHTARVPLDRIRLGENEVMVRWTEAAEIDAYYLDFYRIRFEGDLVGQSDTAIAPGQLAFTLRPEVTSHEIGIVQTDGAAYNLTTATRLAKSRTEQGRTYYLDVATPEAQYAASSLAAYLKPQRMSPWNLKGGDWRLLDHANAADYLVITHPAFKKQAEMLRDRRVAKGLRSMVVTTDEVFNTFDFGSDEPWAIRKFLQYAYNYYPGAPVAFVTLLGDGNWDPKRNLGLKGRSFVPTFGNPVSDYIYTTVEGTGIDSIIPEMVIARIPVESPDEAENYIRKLDEYETQSPAEWNRKFLFMAGGNGPIPNSYENARFLSDIDVYLQAPAYGALELPPLNVSASIISRKDFSSSLDATQVPEIQSNFRQGRSLVHFIGHGATFTTDLFFSDPTLYRNKGLYPVFITLSCRTGAFGEPGEVTLNEQFLRTPDAGAIMAFGTTGYGATDYDFNLSVRLWDLLKSDTLRGDTAQGAHRMNMASLFTQAKLWATLVGSGFVAENSLLQYSVLGDAALGFAFRPQPEFALRANEITFANQVGEAREAFSLDDSAFVVEIPVHNFGQSAIGKVRLGVTGSVGNIVYSRFDTLDRLDTMATVRMRFPIDTLLIGEHTLKIKIDRDDAWEETEEGDNEVSVRVLVTGRSPQPFYPYIAARGFCDAESDTVHFVSMLRSSVSGKVQVELEVDTLPDFSSAVKLGTHDVKSYYYDLAVPRAALPKSFSGVLWWRTRIANVNTWEVSSLELGPAKGHEMSFRSPEQLSTLIYSGLGVGDNGNLSIPTHDTLVYDLVARSLGDSGASVWSISQVFVNGKPSYIMSKEGHILSVLVLSEDESQIETAYEFFETNHDTLRGALEAAKLDSAVASIPAGRHVFVLTRFQPYMVHFSNDPRVIAAMRSLGSDTAWSTLWYFDNYILSGRKGSAPGTARETLVRWGGKGAEMFDTVYTSGARGYAATPLTAVSDAYSDLSWNGPPLGEGNDLAFAVVGERRSGGFDTLMRLRGTAGRTWDLSAIDPFAYPRLKTFIDFERDSSSASSPQMSSFSIGYEPSPELEVDQDVMLSATSIEEGKALVISYTVRNLGCKPSPEFPLALVRGYNGYSDTARRRMVPALGARAEVKLIDTIATFGFEGQNLIRVVLNPYNQKNEQLAFNNVVQRSFDVYRDTSRPWLDVLFDGRHINRGDFVSSRVQIRMQLFDSAAVRVTDSNTISAVIRPDKNIDAAVYISAQERPASYDVSYRFAPTGMMHAELVAQPIAPLEPGLYTIEVTSFDASGNTSDTIRKTFQVAGTNGIEHVMNVPNPFNGSTQFTFILRSERESSVSIDIYSVAGRRIRTLALANPRAGLNLVAWDGRDESGNEVPNGTYLYRIVMRGKNPDGSEVVESVTERCMKSR